LIDPAMGEEDEGEVELRKSHLPKDSFSLDQSSFAGAWALVPFRPNTMMPPRPVFALREILRTRSCFSENLIDLAKSARRPRSSLLLPRFELQ
jgi:hypothetical protein